MKRVCELCRRIARIHCESDQASLCWDCDAKIHSANFLVARHSRNLLCRLCQSLTPWSAAGSQMVRTFSVCGQCLDGRISDESGEEDEKEVADEVEMHENQVTPWSPLPPPSEDFSSSEEPVRGGELMVSRKRCTVSNDHPSDDFHDSLASRVNINAPPSDSGTEVVNGADSLSRRRSVTSPRKIQKLDPGEVRVPESGILESLRRFHQEKNIFGAEIVELRDGPGSVDLNSSDSD